MAAELITIADAVKTALNAASVAQTLSQAFVAVRDYVPGYTEEELATLRVTVIAAGRRRVRLDRSGWAIEYDIDVGIQKKVAVATQKADADALLQLGEEVADFFIGPLAGYAAARFERAEVRAPYDVEHLLAKAAVTIVARLTFLVYA